MSTVAEIKSRVAEDLDDAGVTYSDSALNKSFQDAYDDISGVTGCIIKRVQQIEWQISQNFYDLSEIIPGYLCCKAILNNLNNRFLYDDLSRIQFDQFGQNWELQYGTPQNWTAWDAKRVAVYKKYSEPQGTFDAWVSVKAPTLVSTLTGITYADDDEFIDTSNSVLVAPDMECLFQHYMLGDLLEPMGKFKSAGPYWGEYYPALEEYSQRVRNISLADLLLII